MAIATPTCIPMFLKISHRYLGLVLCLIMLSISVTGVLLLWKKEYLWLTINDARQTIDISLLAATIEKIEAGYGMDEVTFIQLHSEDLALHKVFLSERRYAWHNQEGEQIQVWQNNERWEDWLLDLHHRFLLGNTVGLNIAGFGGLLLMPLLIIGFILWWPRRRTLKLGLWPKSSQRGALQRSHGNIGSVFIVPIFLLTVTGVILVYPVEARWVLLETFTSNDDAPLDVIDETINDVLVNSAQLPSWPVMLALAYEKFPESQVRSVRPASSKYTSRKVNVQQKDGWHRLGRSSVELSGQGRLKTVDALKQTARKRVFNFSYPLHTAKLGLAYKLFVTLVGLAFSMLSVLGLWSFVQSKRV